ncbi:hypothetical protein [Streptomyces gardneri]|uniref:hypothetical protein n=1 Tax=Streptomyces gardneri TaxID=66892 RepID=UPI0035D55FE4
MSPGDVPFGDQTHPRDGQLFKSCDCTRQGRCSHPYAIRYRDATGRQREETGYATQQDALDRLTKVCRGKQDAPQQQALEKRELGKQRFGEYCSTWLPRQRHFAPGTVRTVTQLLDNHVLPSLESRRVNTFSPAVVDDFIQAMEERSTGLATQQNAFDTLKKVLLDAHRRGAITDDPFHGVVPPGYVGTPLTQPGPADRGRAARSRTPRPVHGKDERAPPSGQDAPLRHHL